MKIKLMVVVVVVILVVLFVYVEKIGVMMVLFDDIFLIILCNSIVDLVKKDGVMVQIEDGGNDVGKQLSQVQNMIVQKVDVIIVNVVDIDVMLKIMKMVIVVKILFVYVNCKLVDFDKLLVGVVVVVFDEKQLGMLQVCQVCKLFGGKGDIFVLMGELFNELVCVCIKDIEDVIVMKDCVGMKIVDKCEGKWSCMQGQDIMMNWLSFGIKFDVIVLNNDEMVIGVINVLKVVCKFMLKIVVVGIDVMLDGFVVMKVGELKVLVYQNVIGQGVQVVVVVFKFVKKQLVDCYVNVLFEFVMFDNMNQYVKY